MWLLHVTTLELQEFGDDEIPNYIIASHRWYYKRETTFQDVMNRQNQNTDGYKKVEAFAAYVREYLPWIEWLWIDNCCINKDSASELSKSLNLMFKWYRNAELCLAYLADVELAEGKASVEQSEWFRRGWMLQELLAPRTVVFLAKSWEVVGNKGASRHQYTRSPVGPGLESRITAITGIPEDVLHDYSASRSVTQEEKLKWMEGRSTTCEEDLSYALFGICGVTPGANYGEGFEGARQRLFQAMNFQDNVAAQQAKQHREIVEWLAPPDPWSNYNTARKQHEPETGTWFLESEEYQDWKRSSIRHLWMFGKAGCGKTILFSTVTKDLRQHCENASNVGYAIFYFSFSDERKRRYDDLLLSLVAQLGCKQPGLAMLQQEYQKPDRKALGPDDLQRITLSCIASYDSFFLLLDGLDESPDGLDESPDNDVRSHLLRRLAMLVQDMPHLKILATSRDLPDIRASMMELGAKPLPIAGTSVNKDIHRYLATEMSRDYRLSRLDAKTKTLVEETISTKADGMFRWAYCQLQELKKLQSTRPRYVKDALFSLPADLDGSYERMLLRIDQRLRADALTLLRWIAYARSPPSLGELVDATIIKLYADGDVEIEDRPGLSDTLQILSGLVIIHDDKKDSDQPMGNRYDEYNIYQSEDDRLDENTGLQQKIGKDTKVRLAHFSVKEYLESKRILKGNAKDFHLESKREHRVLAQSCLIYLSYYSNSDEKLMRYRDFNTFPLLSYAARSWFYHVDLQATGTVTREMKLLHNEEALYDWLRVYQPDVTWGRSFRTHEFDARGLYYASYLGLAQVVGELIAIGQDVHALGGRFGNALQAASFMGYEKVVRMLLEAGADVHAQGGYYGNALQAASFTGYEIVVRVLLEAGVDVNAQGGHYGNALQAASWEGYEKVVRMLLVAGADVHAQGGFYGNALQAASFGGEEKVVQMLLEAGADVHAQGIRGSALQVASFGGHEKVVRMLLKAGADLAQRGPYGNALQAASSQGYEKVVRILLEAGAEVHAQGGPYGNALCAASVKGHISIVELLLAQDDIDIGFLDRQQWTALHWAAYFGQTTLIKQLLLNGADPTKRDWQGWTPHNVAVFAGHDISDLRLQGDVAVSVVLPGKRLRGYCAACHHDLIQYQYHCQTCKPRYDLCFRCFQDVRAVHPGHEFTADFRWKKLKA